MNNPTYPKNIEQIPNIFFDCVKGGKLKRSGQEIISNYHQQTVSASGSDSFEDLLSEQGIDLVLGEAQ